MRPAKVTIYLEKHSDPSSAKTRHHQPDLASKRATQFLQALGHGGGARRWCFSVGFNNSDTPVVVVVAVGSAVLFSK